MSLIDRKLKVDTGAVPREVQCFLREADRRIERFRRDSILPGFVPSDFPTAYCVLRALAAELPLGSLLCEWGSGFGVVSGLAAMLEFDVLGIEIQAELVEEARRLANDFELPAQFVCGSYLPAQAAALLNSIGEFSWLETAGNNGYDEAGLSPNDFNVIFCYPWPDEVAFTRKLFDRCAARGALLVTHHGGDEFCVCIKK